MEVKVIRQKRKTLSLSLDETGTAIVKAPLHVTKTTIETFVISKKRWLQKQLQLLKNKNTFANQFDFTRYVYILGRPIPYDNFGLTNMNCIKKSPSNLMTKIRQLYMQKAETYLMRRFNTLSNQTKIGYSSIKLTNSRRVWGSFDRERNVKLNWRLIILPTELIDYVMIHELCHGIELNHSPKFWKTVEKFLPTYKKCKNDLSMYSFLLREM